MNEIVNAKITGTMLGFEDHGIFTCFVFLDYGHTSQGFGGYYLSYHTEMIEEILKTVGVSTWEELKGKFLRVERNRYTIVKIGHITEDKWYQPRQDK
jgi:hypothetical protein